jgi:SAM-dependent methyltransferase
MTWSEYWNDKTTVYVSDRHRTVHYATVARDLIGLLPSPDAWVVDYGCGEALSANMVADACGQLFLCDCAGAVRDRLRQRHMGRSDISVISPLQFEQLPDGAIDLIVVNSVVQYLSAADFQRLLALARRKLHPAGTLLLGDIIPPSVGPLTDAVALLSFAKANGFLLSAGAGLVRSFFSKYRRTRGAFGILQFDEQELIEILQNAGYRARRCYPNLGHNQKRMALMASPDGARSPAVVSMSPPHAAHRASGSATAA